MRITGGEFGGLRLASPLSDKTRPTEDRVRQALFNVLGTRILRKRVLDFFAGTGALGIEALSRGASYAVFMENDPRAQKTLRANLQQIPVLPGSYRVLNGDALRSAIGLTNEDEKFHLIFLDPPYQSGLYEPALSVIDSGKLLQEDGWVVVEHSSRLSPVIPEEVWRIEKVKVYGETTLEFLGLKPKEAR